jgi:urate oxidase
MAKLSGHRYGKARVRVMKILRDGPVHTLKDLDVAAYLQGDFASSYTSGDNSKVVATDTIKNTINVFAQQHLGEEVERFGLILAEHFLSRYEQVEEAEVQILERPWKRLMVNGEPHPHSFVAGSEARMFASVKCGKTAKIIRSGIRDLIILKSRVSAAWSTSLEVEVEVFSEEILTGLRKLTSVAYLTFVAIDSEKRRIPIPGLILETEEEKRKAAEANERRAARLEARKQLEARSS